MSKDKSVLFHFRNFQQVMLCDSVPRTGEVVLLGLDTPHGVVEAVLYAVGEDGQSLLPHVLLREASDAEKEIVAKFDNVR